MKVESVVFTIGHSTRTFEELIDLLKRNGVTHLVDVRTIPRSRRNPQFGIDVLPGTMAAVGVNYTHMPDLGGLRHAHADSINLGWINLSFRGYADYMQCALFAEQIDRLVEMSKSEQCAIMCAEAVPWRCHRSLIADALLVRNVKVEDIIGPKGRRPHTLTLWAKADGFKLTYPDYDKTK